MNLAYVRISSMMSKTTQVEALSPFEIDIWYEDNTIGKDADRPNLIEMLNNIQPGDSVYVSDFVRLARNTEGLLEILDLIKSKGANLVSVKENLNTAAPTGDILVAMIDAINEFEKQSLLEKQREGISIAKQQGKYPGRQYVELDEIEFIECYKMYMCREISLSEMAKRLGIARQTLYNRIELYKETGRINSDPKKNEEAN